MNSEAQLLVVRLLTHRALPRTDTGVKRALVDEAFREALDAQLLSCGLRLLDNPQAGHVALGLESRIASRVFGDEHWCAENLGLDKHAAATLVVVWALLILPKRERQARVARGQVQDKDLFGVQTQIIVPPVMAESLAVEAFIADYARVLGTKSKINISLGVLARLGFIERSDNQIHEGPLLDLALDYASLAPRVLDGSLQHALGLKAATLEEG